MTDRLDAELLRDFPLPHVAEDSGKEERGRLLVIAGSRELAGAALLAGTAALRAGAGKLQLGTAASIAAPIAVAMPEARVIAHTETEDGCIAEAGIPALIECAKEAQAVLLGCGMRHGPTLERLLAELCPLPVPLQLDAAALDCLSNCEAAIRARKGGTLLLPHQREMARLLDVEASEVEADPQAAASQAARRFNAATLVKGAPSHVVAPDGRAFSYPGGGVGLATSGSGDVLAGLAAGLAARGADPLTALLWAVWLHGEAGRLLSQEVGRLGFLARELPGKVPGLLPE